MRFASPGHVAFAVVMIALGIMSLVTGDFAPIWQNAPKAPMMREALIYLTALISLGCGAGLLWRQSAALASRLLLAALLLWMLLFKIRFIFLAPTVEGSYQSNGENAVLVAGAWVLYAWFAADGDRKYLGFATGESGLRVARVLYGLALLAFGFSHFVYLNLTAPIIPDWIPWHVFWAYFTGCAYLAAGAAILAGIYARLAAALSALQMGSFIFLVWLPMAFAGKMTGFNWGELVVTCALAAGGWVVADSYRGRPWLAMRGRAMH